MSLDFSQRYWCAHWRKPYATGFLGDITLTTNSHEEAIHFLERQLQEQQEDFLFQVWDSRECCYVRLPDFVRMNLLEEKINALLENAKFDTLQHLAISDLDKRMQQLEHHIMCFKEEIASLKLVIQEK